MKLENAYIRFTKYTNCWDIFTSHIFNLCQISIEIQQFDSSWSNSIWFGYDGIYLIQMQDSTNWWHYEVLILRRCMTVESRLTMWWWIETCRNGLVAINIAVYLFGLASPKGMPGMVDASLPFLYGAKVNELIVNGEWWRMVTPMFLVRFS